MPRRAVRPSGDTQAVQYKPIPIIHPGGYQPYARAGGQAPGPALVAMLAGRTAGGQNPMDAVRGAQVARRRPTLLDLLLRNN